MTVRVRSQEDIVAMEATPLSEHNLPASTYEYLREGCLHDPDKIGLKYFLRAPEYAADKVSFKNKIIDKVLRLTSGEQYATPYIEYSFGEVWHKINQTANLLHDLGVGKEDVVSLILPNFSETYFCLWGAEATGIVNPLNPMLEPEIMREVMNAAGTKVLITVGNIPGSDIWKKVEKTLDQVPTLEKVIVLHGKTPGHKDCVRYWSKIEAYNGDALDSNRRFQASDIASMFHTGGTTGIPKIALHTHANEVTVTRLMNITTDVSRDDVTLVGLPIFHVNGSLGSGLGSWSRGNTIVLAGPAGYRTAGLFDCFFDILAHHRITWFSVVPTILSLLLEKPAPSGLDLSKLRFVICGSAPLSMDVLQTFESRFDLRVLEVYGLTECTLLSSICPLVDNPRVGSIGLRLPYVEMKPVLLDADGSYLRDCEIDEVGVLAQVGPTVFPGYKEEAHNVRAWIFGEDGRRWFNTGDLARQDSDGYFWITGRTKELIIRGGHNIDPAMIEEALYQHPDVSMAAAVGRPDAHATEVPVAYVSLIEGANTTADELEAFAREHIPERVAIPKAIMIVPELPLTAIGKIFKPALVWREVEAVYRQALSGLNGKIDIQSIKVGNDKKLGTLARVYINIGNNQNTEHLSTQVKELLGRLPIRFELLVNQTNK